MRFSAVVDNSKPSRIALDVLTKASDQGIQTGACTLWPIAAVCKRSAHAIVHVYLGHCRESHSWDAVRAQRDAVRERIADLGLVSIRRPVIVNCHRDGTDQ